MTTRPAYGTVFPASMNHLFRWPQLDTKGHYYINACRVSDRAVLTEAVPQRGPS
jgi:hypothetical protein